MLTIEPPIYQVRGTPIFRDHADADLFYVLPGVPVLVVVGERPGFRIYKYRRDLTDNPALDPTQAMGGGLAMFDVQTSTVPITALVAEVSARAERPNARVVPVVFRSGIVRSIVAQSEGDHLISDVVESSIASVTAPHHASFAMALTPEGTTLFQAAALGGQLPVGVAYELKFLALTPALHAHVTMDDDRAYERFSGSVGFSYYVNARLDAEISKLVADGIVKIEITQFIDDADQRRQHEMVLGLLKSRVQQDFFRPTIPTPPVAGAGGVVRDMVSQMIGESVTSASAWFVLKAKYELVREEKTFEINYDGRTAIELTHVTTGGISTMAPDGPSVEVLEIDLDDEFFDTLRVTVRVAVDFDEMTDLDSVTVNFAHGEHRFGALFASGRADVTEFVVPLAGPRDDEYTLETEYRFNPTLGTGEPVVHVGPLASRQRAVVVSPAADLQYTMIELVPLIDWTAVTRAEVEIVGRSADGSREFVRDTVVLDASTPQTRWRFHRPIDDPASFSLRTTWEEAGGQRHVGDRERLRGSSYVVRAGFATNLQITVTAPLDWNKFLQAVVEIHYEDGAHVADRMLTFDATSPPADVVIPLLHTDVRTFRSRTTLIRTNGTTEVTPWTESDGGRVITAHDPTATTAVNVTWVGDPAGALGLLVNFRVAQPTGEFRTSVFFRPGDTDKVVQLPVSSRQPLAYNYEVRRATEAGEEVVTAGTGGSNVLIVRAQ